MKGMLKDAAILFAITLVAGLILGGVYYITKEPIRQSELKAQKEAFQSCFSEMSEVETLKGSKDAGNTFLEENGMQDAEFSDEAVIAKSSTGEQIGYIFTVTTHEGYGGDIKMTLGVKLDGTVTGVSLLTISETPGLGMKAGDILVPQFQNKQVEQFEYTKTGAAAENQIDAISGATITTNAVTNAVNAGLSYYQQIMKQGGNL